MGVDAVTVAALVNGLSVTDIVLLLGFLAVILDRIADGRGWSRSAKTLRRENEDLVRRNQELEQTVARHEDKIQALETHEVRADTRHARTLEVLTDIRDTLKDTTKGAGS